MHLLAQNRRNRRRNQTSRVDREVEHREEHRQLQLLLGQHELVAAEGGHAGFYPARAQRYEDQAQHGQASVGEVQGPDGGEGEDDVAGRVDHGQVEDGVEFAEETVRDDGAEDREEVDEHGEGMVDDGGVALAVREDVVEVEGEDGCWKRETKRT